MIDWIIEDIKKNADPVRAEFQRKLCNTKYEIVGCTNPYLRNFAKQLKKSKDYEDFLNSESNVYEYVFMQGILISYLNDVERMKDFVFKIDDWGICDCTHLQKQSKEYLDAIFDWVKSDKEFVTRYAVISYMCVYLNKYSDEMDDKFIEEIYKINHHEYYVDMAIAWFIQKLYSFNIDKASKMLENENITAFAKKKAISKIKDSLRERKARG